MKTSPRISVIVPVYNAEKWLRRCVDSILAQTFTDFEVLLIDDGSTDGSGAICDEYAIQDQRVRVFHKPNGGVSSARNLGLDSAQGEWMTFADSDDYIESNMLVRMIKKINDEQADIVIADYFETSKDRDIKVSQNLQSLKSEDLISGLLQGHIIGSTCNKLFSKRLFTDNDIHFPKDIDYCEDLIAIVQILLHNPKVVVLSGAFYHYDTSTTDSITRKYTSKLYEHQKRAATFLQFFLGKKFELQTMDYTLRILGNAISHGYISKDEFKEVFPYTLFQIVSSIQRSPVGRRAKLKVLLSKIAGIKLGQRLSKLL